MRIGIDYRFAITSVRGIGKYIREIVTELMVLDAENEYILYCQEKPKLALPANFSSVVLGRGNLVFFEQYNLPRQAAKDKIDVLWYPSNSGPVFLNKKIKLVVTVHDLISMERPSSGGPVSPSGVISNFAMRYRSLALQFGLKRINTLVTVSEYSRGAISRHLGAEARVVTNQIRRGDVPLDDGILLKLNLVKGKYIFSLTGEAPHKNLSGLIELSKSEGLKSKLVISGVYNPELIAGLSAGQNSKAIFTGKITDAEKNSLYQNAAAFLFIPLAEGFGIPILEAMQAHLPIIASNTTSVPEVLGAGGKTVDPTDRQAIFDLIGQLPWAMDGLVQAQKTQLKKYSDWTEAGKSMVRIFEELCEI